MDGSDKRRKRKRAERREAERKRIYERIPEKKRKLLTGPKPARPRHLPERPEKPPYRLLKTARKIEVFEGLVNALDDVARSSSERLSDMLGAIEHPDLPIVEAVRSPLPIKPVEDISDTQIKSRALADEFAKPDEKRSDIKPRDRQTCKERPKDNRRKGGGSGGKKRFIPWCG